VPTVLVAAGSNVDAERHIRLAARELAAAFPGTRFSRAYRNAAVGFAGEDFINFVARFETALAPPAVLATLHRIEADCGRPREAAKWAPRTMDLDLLLHGALVGEGAGFRVPRPDLLQRAYMLGPAAEVAPDVVHPVRGQTLAALWIEFERASATTGSAHALVPLPLKLGGG
jgi:2-amino-4-hydroxy-6-hydroxymethyldihydropteridine diphosphokinase